MVISFLANGLLATALVAVYLIRTHQADSDFDKYLRDQGEKSEEFMNGVMADIFKGDER